MCGEKTVIFIATVEKQIQQNVVEIYGKLKSFSYFYIAYKEFIWNDLHNIFLKYIWRTLNLKPRKQFIIKTV